ncbi:MAG: hypothetical protein Q9219_000377 [cf. Caloplaca sp. 3 TL-2023]
MPYALSTTKRKFHEILDSIANPPTTSLHGNQKQHNAPTTSSLSEVQGPCAKRPKYSRPISTPLPPSLARKVGSTPTASTMAKEPKLPNFAPWDRNQFLSRLETFRHVDKWMSKPDPINEIQWAKRGWTCVGKERVGCVGGCGNELLILLEPSREEQQASRSSEPDGETEDDELDWREEAQKELMLRYTEMIVTEHDEGCLWRRRGCDDSIHRLPLAHQATTFQSLRQRYESLCAFSTDLPSNIALPSSLDIPKLVPHLLHILYPDLKNAVSNTPHPASPSTNPTTDTTATNNQNDSLPTINPHALTLALTGWQTDPSSPIPGIATCTSCFRRLGLWLYNPPPPPSPPPSSPPSSPTSPPIITHLDPISEHRPYCPWINPRSQSRNPIPTEAEIKIDLPGWEILREMLMRVRPAAAAALRLDGAEREGEGREVDGEGTKSKEERDRERWARLKRLKGFLRVGRKREKGKEKEA